MSSPRNAKDGPRYAPDMAAQARRPTKRVTKVAVKVKPTPPPTNVARTKRIAAKIGDAIVDNPVTRGFTALGPALGGVKIRETKKPKK